MPPTPPSGVPVRPGRRPPPGLPVTIRPPPGRPARRPPPGKPRIVPGAPAPRGPYFPNSLSGSFPEAPIHLAAQATLTAGSSSGVNAESLRNPLNLPMLIDQIKFQIRSPIGGLAGLPTLPILTGATIAASFTLDEQHLTSGFIPLWCFGRSLRVDTAEIDPGGESNGQNSGNYHAHFRWNLPKPLYIAPGQALTPHIAHLGFIPQAATVIVSYAARTMSPGYRPKGKIAIPWVSAYTSKVFNAYSVADSEVSKETDLVNPFDIPINVQRMIGRINLLNNTAQSGGANAINVLTPTIDAADFGSNLLTIRMFSSRGEPLIPNLSLFQSVFQHPTKSWEVPHQMPPRSFYAAELQKAAPVDQNTTFLMQAFISIVGYRDVEIKR